MELWGVLVGVSLALLLIVIFLARLAIKNNELRATVEVVSRDVGLLQDSQQGLGRHLLELELQMHNVLKMQASGDMVAASGSLNQIADLLRAGALASEVITALGVSEAEVKLVQMILRSSGATGDGGSTKST
ncbi:MAG: hypothetical protein P8H97_07960 [Pseudomonadales bacterium]|nr:hypothetical protein [Pseudomonadales bacterium]MDG2079562.1 hypothetical protein [Pseudomonadales bacterium]